MNGSSPLSSHSLNKHLIRTYYLPGITDSLASLSFLSWGLTFCQGDGCTHMTEGTSELGQHRHDWKQSTCKCPSTAPKQDSSLRFSFLDNTAREKCHCLLLGYKCRQWLRDYFEPYSFIQSTNCSFCLRYQLPLPSLSREEPPSSKSAWGSMSIWRMRKWTICIQKYGLIILHTHITEYFT